MGCEWVEVRLRDICEVITKGTTPTTLGHKFTDAGVNFVKSESVTFDGSIDKSKFAYISHETHDALKRSQLKEGDILFSMAGVYIGKTAVVPVNVVPANTNQAVGIIRLLKDKACPRFIDYHLRNPSYNRFLNNLVAQSAQPNLNLTEIGNLPISLPPYSEQRSIASILSSLDDRIALLRETNATLEAIAQAIFKSWFVDFDPVKAKAEGREPEGGMGAETAALFPSGFEESELGMIPKGWRVQTFGDIVDVVGGGTPSTKEPAYWENGVHHWATPKDLSALNTPVLFDTERQITDAGLSKISSGLLPAGTLLMSSRAPIGYIAIAEVPVAINQGFIAMKPKHGITNMYLLNIVRDRMEEIKSRANGSTFMEISKAAFKPIPITTPAGKVIDAYDSAVRPLFRRLVENEAQRRTLASLRDTLLPRLMSGQLRVPEAERMV